MLRRWKWPTLVRLRPKDSWRSGMPEATGQMLNEREVAEVPMALSMEMKRMMVDEVDDGGECEVRNLNGLRLSLKFLAAKIYPLR